MSKKIVTFGEIMLRLATPGYERFSQSTQFNATFGGGEANVAVSLANYGMETEFVTRLPKNDIADSCIMNLRKYNVGTKEILRGGDRVGIYFLETGAVARASKVVYDRANSSIADIKPGMVNWREVLKGADWFHWTGITPALSQGAADACMEAITIANEMGVTVSTDLNYRKNLWEYGKSASEVMPALVAGCDIILGNEEDAEKVFGIKPEGFDVAHTGGEVNSAEFTSPPVWATSNPSGLMPNTFSASSSFPKIISHPATNSGITSEADFPYFHKFLRKFKSVETVTPISFAIVIASRHASAAPWDKAGVMPVQWNQSAPFNTSRQFTIPGLMSAIDEFARSYTTLLARATAPVSRK